MVGNVVLVKHAPSFPQCALAFAVGGKVKADIELQPLSAINQIFDRLERGDVASRVVLDFNAG
jgi:propanol-preferring alcohol dehydrogenase